MSDSVSVAKGWHAEHLPLLNIWLFLLIFLFFLQVPHKLYCAPRAPAVRNLGARTPASSMAPAPMPCWRPCRLQAVGGDVITALTLHQRGHLPWKRVWKTTTELQKTTVVCLQTCWHSKTVRNYTRCRTVGTSSHGQPVVSVLVCWQRHTCEWSQSLCLASQSGIT